MDRFFREQARCLHNKHHNNRHVTDLLRRFLLQTLVQYTRFEGCILENVRAFDTFRFS
jgi:hypothetical protein